MVGSLPVTAARPCPLPGPVPPGGLLAGLVLPLAGCTGSSPGPTPPPAPAPVDPDVALRAAAVERETALLAAYDAVLGGSSLRGAGRRPRGARRAPRRAGPGRGGAPLPGSRRRPVPWPRGRRRLRAAEREAAAAHAADALPASRGLAALLASLAAAEAAHGVVLA